MKIRKTLLSFACAIMVALSFTACGDDWGRQDDPAGGQIYPSKQTVATYDFEYSDEKPEYSDMVEHDEGCEIVNDENLASNVLHINGKGGAKIANPFNSVKLQNGAAITFAVKIDADVAEDGTVADVDLTRPLISFGSDEMDADKKNNIGARFYLTANGQAYYSKPGQLQSLDLNENDPATVKTGILSPNEWHFVALQLSTEGYQIYVDGKKSLSGYQTSSSATAFQYKTLVDSINTLPYLYIGGDKDLTAEETNVVSIDNVTLIRNMMEEKDWNKTIGGNAEEKFEYVIGDPITDVGASDNSAGFWTAWSNYYRIPAEGTIHLQFTNHSSKVANWNNWVAAVTTDADRNAGGYTEYLVLRSDLYGWGTSYASGAWTSDGYGDWDAFREDMDGAVVEMTISRSGANVTVKAVATATSGNVYTESFTAPCGDGKDVLRAFLTVDGSSITMDTKNCYVVENVDVNTTEVGASDNSAGFWSAWTDYFSIPANYTLHLNFKNGSSTVANWNNFVAAVTNDVDRNGTGYTEYLILRADLYGWGTSYGSGSWTNEGYGDWDAFRADMDGANVNLTVARSGENVTVTAVSTCPNGNVYKETFAAPCGDANEVLRSFLSVDGCHLTMNPSGCYLSKGIYE